MTRDELIAALKQATGPSRELDLHIWAALYAPTAEIRQSQFNGEWCAYKAGQEKLYEARHAPKYLRYTEFTDEALTLVPKGYYWLAGNCKRESHATVAPEGIDDERAHDGFSAPGNVALAICIASMKART